MNAFIIIAINEIGEIEENKNELLIIYQIQNARLTNDDPDKF